MIPKFNIYDRVKYKYDKRYGRIVNHYYIYKDEIFKHLGHYYDILYPDGTKLKEVPEEDIELVEEDSLAKPVYLTSAHKIGQAIWIKDALKECGIGGSKMDSVIPDHKFKIGEYVRINGIQSIRGAVISAVIGKIVEYPTYKVEGPLTEGYFYDIQPLNTNKVIKDISEDRLESIKYNEIKSVYKEILQIEDIKEENKMNNSDIRPFKVGNYIETRTTPSKKGFISHVVSIDGGPDTWCYDVELYDPETGKHITHHHVKHTNLSHITETEYRFYKEHSANFTTKESADSYYIPKRIIYNDPATIVFWNDGTKTVVKKAEGETFNSYTAFCAALAKKTFGNNSTVNKIVRSGYYQKDKNAK